MCGYQRHSPFRTTATSGGSSSRAGPIKGGAFLAHAVSRAVERSSVTRTTTPAAPTSSPPEGQWRSPLFGDPCRQLATRTPTPRTCHGSVAPAAACPTWAILRVSGERETRARAGTKDRGRGPEGRRDRGWTKHEDDGGGGTRDERGRVEPEAWSETPGRRRTRREAGHEPRTRDDARGRRRTPREGGRVGERTGRGHPARPDGPPDRARRVDRRRRGNASLPRIAS